MLLKTTLIILENYDDLTFHKAYPFCLWSLSGRNLRNDNKKKILILTLRRLPSIFLSRASLFCIADPSCSEVPKIQNTLPATRYSQSKNRKAIHCKNYFINKIQFWQVWYDNIVYYEKGCSLWYSNIFNSIYRTFKGAKKFRNKIFK